MLKVFYGKTVTLQSAAIMLKYKKLLEKHSFKGRDYVKDFIIAMGCVLVGAQIGMSLSISLRKRIQLLDIFKPVFALVAGVICGSIAVLSIFWPITLVIFLVLAVVLSS